MISRNVKLEMILAAVVEWRILKVRRYWIDTSAALSVYDVKLEVLVSSFECESLIKSLQVVWENKYE